MVYKRDKKSKRNGESRRSATRHAARHGMGHLRTQRQWRLVQNPHPPFEILSEAQLRRIDAAAMKILADTGLRFRNVEALEILDQHGAQVDFDSQMVAFDADVIRRHIAKAPRKFVLYARNEAKNLTIGENYINFAPVSGPPNFSDIDGGRRPGTHADQCNLIKLCHGLNTVHLGGVSVEAMDLPADSRHLDFCRAQTLLNDCAWNTRAIGRRRVADALEINCIARGIDKKTLIEKPGLTTVININSPLMVDAEMLAGLMEMTRHGQPCIITPFTLAGAMSPATIAGALAQQTAEALAVLAFVQMVRPGCPCVFGGFTSNVDMKSGAPAFGTPEYVKGVLAGGQLARHYRLPYRASNVNAANTADAQATYESAMSLWACFLAHANVVHHAVGWLEGGLCASLEKFIIDAEMIQMLSAAFSPLKIDDDEFGLDAIAEVGPGGHFFAAAHTMARYRDAFYQPLLSDWRNFETWQDDGAQTATQRANRIARNLLAAHQSPPLPAAAIAEIDAFIEKRKAEIARDGEV